MQQQNSGYYVLINFNSSAPCFSFSLGHVVLSCGWVTETKWGDWWADKVAFTTTSAKSVGFNIDGHFTFCSNISPIISWSVYYHSEANKKSLMRLFSRISVSAMRRAYSTSTRELCTSTVWWRGRWWVPQCSLKSRHLWSSWNHELFRWSYSFSLSTFFVLEKWNAELAWGDLLLIYCWTAFLFIYQKEEKKKSHLQFWGVKSVAIKSLSTEFRLFHIFRHF